MGKSADRQVFIGRKERFLSVAEGYRLHLNNAVVAIHFQGIRNYTECIIRKNTDDFTGFYG